MINYLKIAFAVLFGILITSAAQAESKAAATVNGVAIPQARLDLRVKALTAQGQPNTPELRDAVLDELINIELLAQAANKQGFSKNSEVIQQTEMAKQSILVNAFMVDYAKKHAISDEALKQEYDRINKMRGTKEYKVSHILVKTEAEATAVEEQLKTGKFEDIAMNKSQDQGSSVNGGDLGWSVPANYVKPFADAIINLKKGQISAPVQSQHGWHVIKLEDVRDIKTPEFESVKPQLVQRMQQQLVQKAIAEQRAKAKIK